MKVIEIMELPDKIKEAIIATFKHQEKIDEYIERWHQIGGFEIKYEQIWNDDIKEVEEGIDLLLTLKGASNSVVASMAIELEVKMSNLDMNKIFTERMGINIPEKEITIRNDANQELRSYLLLLIKQTGLGLKKIREILCFVLRKAPDPQNWGENEFMESEIESLLLNCEWYQVYDFIEEFYKRINRERKAVFYKELNAYFLQEGIGWKLNDDGVLEARGDGEFEISIQKVESVLAEKGLDTSRNEIKEAIKDLSRRPESDITGAIQHAFAALECVVREVTGDKEMTLGKLVKKYSSIAPKPIPNAIESLWGFSSNQARHIKEGGKPTYEEAELSVHISAALCSYLSKKHIKTPKTFFE